MTVCAVVLAAGRGARFDAPDHKLLAEVRGRAVVRWSVEAPLAAGLPTVVVQGAVDLRPALDGLDVTVVDNPRWPDGQATSLQAGVTWARGWHHDAVVVGLGDQPFVTAAAWAAVAGADERPVAVATYGGARRNPVRLAVDVWPLLPTEGDEGARRLVGARPELVTAVACDGDPHDIDTTEDLLRWS